MTIEMREALAAKWLIRSEAEDFAAKERVALEEWLGASPGNRAVYLRLSAAWRRTEQLRRLKPLDGAVNANLLTETILPSLRRLDRKPRRVWRYVAVGTAVAALLVGAARCGTLYLARMAGTGH